MRDKFLIVVLTAIVALVVWVGVTFYKAYEPKKLILQGEIDAQTYNIASKLPGRISKVYVKKGDKVDVVLECTGAFLTQESVQAYLDNGIKKVLFSAPAKDDTPTFVVGVNSDEYAGEQIISNASCTTNCLGLIAKILDTHFGIKKGLMTTIHSYTNDQKILDVKHHKDTRRGRAAAINMIPTTTGAAKAIGKVIPELLGKMHGQAVRVPTPNVSLVDLNVVVSKNTTIEEVNEALIEASKNELKDILAIDYDKCVSSDFTSSLYSSIVAIDLTQVIGGIMVKVMAWYDNEMGYSNRLVDMAVIAGSYK